MLQIVCGKQNETIYYIIPALCTEKIANFIIEYTGKVHNKQELS